MFTQSRLVSCESYNIRTSGNHTFRWIRHSSSFKVILIGVSRNPERVVVIMYNIVDAISETYNDRAWEPSTANSLISTAPSVLTTVLRESPSNIYKLYCPKLESLLIYILPLIVGLWVCLHSNFCGGFRKMHLSCNGMRIGRSRSFKVDESTFATSC